MRHFSFLKNIFFAFAAIATIVACDDEFSELGSDVVDGDIHNSLNNYSAFVSAYDRATGPVQTSNLDVNLLGSYNNPLFGRTTASYITQVQLASVNPGLTENVQIDSVFIYVPYASNLVNTETNSSTEETDRTYKLTGVYGTTGENAKFKLKLRENTFYLRSGDAGQGGSQSQFYYSDDQVNFDTYQTTSLFENGATEVETFFNKAEIKRRAEYKDDEGNTKKVIAEALAPGMFFYLNKDFFSTKMLNGDRSQLINNNTLANYFRGISFYVEPVGDASTMIAPDFANGYIKIIYNQDDFDSKNQPIMETVNGAEQRKREHLTMTLNLAGAKVNLLKNELNGIYASEVATANTETGDDRLYIKGGEGSMAVVNILNNEDITALKNKDYLINEANLKFYIDENSFNNYDSIPRRIYLYDLTNKRPLYDYSVDGTTVSGSPKLNKYIYGGVFDSINKCYTVRLTHHVNNIINKDSTNVKLGLSLTDNIATSSNAAIRTPFTENGVNVTTVPAAHVITPLGIILNGTGTGTPADKRLKLEIFYTKPEN